MHARIVAQLGMEGGDQQASLASGDRAAIMKRGQRRHARPQPLDHRRADEDGVKGTTIDAGDVQILLEAVALVAEGIAPYA